MNMKLPRIYVDRVHNHQEQQALANEGLIAATSFDSVKALFPWAKAIVRKSGFFIVFPTSADYQLWRREQPKKKGMKDA
jgi:hypothetical protein